MRAKIFAFGIFFLGVGFIQAEISPELLKEKFVKIERVSSKATGFYLGLREAKSKRQIKVEECRFHYEKGLDTHPKNNKEYAYERFIVSFSGKDGKGETSFDSVTYGISAYADKYQDLNFKNGFGFIPMMQIELDGNNPVARLKAVRSTKGELQLIFNHKEVYSAKNSSFFLPQEQREYDVVVTFEKFDSHGIHLQGVTVSATQLSSQSEKKKKIVEVSCENFKEEE